MAAADRGSFALVKGVAGEWLRYILVADTSFAGTAKT